MLLCFLSLFKTVNALELREDSKVLLHTKIITQITNKNEKASEERLYFGDD